MNTKILFQSILFFFFCILKTNAQEVVNLEEAVKIALENNYEIKIASNVLNLYMSGTYHFKDNSRCIVCFFHSSRVKKDFRHPIRQTNTSTNL